VSANHLIIGLGGTGGKIIRAYRKTISRNFAKRNPTEPTWGIFTLIRALK
jgi:hypothetical protein